MRRTWSWTTEEGLPVRLAAWGHYGRPVLWLGPGASDHLQLDRYGLVDAAAPSLRAGRLKLYGVDRPLEAAGLAAEVLARMHADSGHTEQAFGILAGDEAAAGALALAARTCGPGPAPRVDRVLLLDPHGLSRVPAPPSALRVHALGEDLPERPWIARRARAGDVHPPGWRRWCAVLDALLPDWLQG